MSRVVKLSAGGHWVEIESDEPLGEIAAKALELWRATDDPRATHRDGTVNALVEQSGQDPALGWITSRFGFRA